MKRILGVLLTMYLLSSCVHKPFQPITPTPTTTPVADDCNGITPSFATDIQPIFKATCAKSGCHDGIEMPQDLSLYSDLKHYLDDSAIYYYVIINRTMPQDIPLDTAQLQLVKCWLNNGAPNN